MSGHWDLTALINAADARASVPERHLWLVRLNEWVRHGRTDDAERKGTPLPVLRLKHLMRVLEQQPALREQVSGTLQAFWREIDVVALLADFGFGSRTSLSAELLTRVQQRLLPASPDTRDLATLFPLLFDDRDPAWIAAIDDELLGRLAALLQPADMNWRGVALQAMTMLASGLRAAAFSPLLRLRMDPIDPSYDPFQRLSAAVERLHEPLATGRRDQALAIAEELRALLRQCLAAADTVPAHLEAYGVSVDVLFELDQMRGRVRRIERLLALALAEDVPSEARCLLVDLLAVQRERRGVRRLLASHYSMLARQVAERSAETGEHYITRDRAEYRDMLQRALGGGAVIAGTTFVKFAIYALGLTAFWAGFFAGVNYALSFVVVMLLHWTVATKQPAMTAPAMAASLPADGLPPEEDTEAIERFVDRVAQLTRSQAAGILGNLVACGPLVLAIQLLCVALFGAPLVGTSEAEHSLHALTLLGPTALFAAFTGVLLFASSLIAGWAENWFVLHRLDSAIAWNPRIVARLGAPRAKRWAAWWRANISSVAANVSLGMMLGLVPALLAFFGLPIEVRHVTLSTGQLGAALGALGWSALAEPALWWCVAGLAATGALNVGVSFWCAFKVALRSRGVRTAERERIRAAIRRRLRSQPLSFLWPPREAATPPSA